ncbi:MAG: SDR family NAD(P)-dependent oxidoreductase [Cyclobacteriaceae bacterium]
MIAYEKILVTGGASFIGSHLVNKLVNQGYKVRVADDLSSGLRENIQNHIDNTKIEFLQGDLKDSTFTRKAVQDIDLILHLAADHGGRGYVETHQMATSSNFILDGVVFHEALSAGVSKIVYASSGCVYPNYKQSNPDEILYLTEDLVGPPYDADNIYGWAKLMAEMTLKSFCKETNMKAASCRYFTVYGPRGVENHAIIAMIARAMIKQNPFEIWGDGTQIRNWTYVDDIVEGTLLAAEKIDDGTAVNIGTMERTSVLEAVQLILQMTSTKLPLKFLPDMPVGPLNRVADNSLAQSILGFKPRVSFKEGLQKTIDWYFSNHEIEETKYALMHDLLDR